MTSEAYITLPKTNRYRSLGYRLLLAKCQIIEDALARLGSITEASKELKVSRATIYRMIEDGRVRP